MQNVLTYQAFQDWLFRQPDDRSFNFGSLIVCPGAHYAQSLGMKDFYGLPHYLGVSIERGVLDAFKRAGGNELRNYGKLKEHIPRA